MSPSNCTTTTKPTQKLILVTSEKSSFFQAHAMCQEISAALAPPLSKRKIEDINVFLRENTDLNSRPVWVGLIVPTLSNGTASKRLELVDGSVLNVNANDLSWTDEEPGSNTFEKKCVAVNNTLHWQAFNCSIEQNFLCEINCGFMSISDSISDSTVILIILIFMGILFVLVYALKKRRRCKRFNKGLSLTSLREQSVARISHHPSHPSFDDSSMTGRFGKYSFNADDNKKLSYLSAQSVVTVKTLGIDDLDKQRRLKKLSKKMSACLSVCSNVLLDSINEMCPGNSNKEEDIVRKVMPFIDTVMMSANARSSLPKEFRVLESNDASLPSLQEYLVRILQGLSDNYEDPDKGVAPKSLIFALIYINRFVNIPATQFSLTEHNSHKLFAVFILIAAKFIEDEEILNDDWGIVTGIGMYELIYLEELICFTMNFDFTINAREMENFIRVVKTHYERSRNDQA